MRRLEHRLNEPFGRGTGGPAPRWSAPVFLVMAVALVPWIAYLAITLPSRTVSDHYRVAWVGFDVVLVIFMAATAWLALKGKRQVELPAIVTATLLVVDAWFDVITSHTGWGRMEAILLAVCVELPTAALAVYISRRVERAIEATLEHAAHDRAVFGHDRQLAGILPTAATEKDAESA